MAEKADDKETSQPTVIERIVTREVAKDPPAGPNAKSEVKNPEDHYFLNSAGDKINAWGEPKGSPEDKRRWA